MVFPLKTPSSHTQTVQLASLHNIGINVVQSCEFIASHVFVSFIVLQDMNDKRPHFERETYSAVISEDYTGGMYEVITIIYLY